MTALRLTSWGKPGELREVPIALARAGRIRVELETFPLGEVPQVYERLRRGEIRDRGVVVPAR